MIASSPLQSDPHDETDRVGFYLSSRDAPGAVSWKETLDQKGQILRFVQNDRKKAKVRQRRSEGTTVVSALVAARGASGALVAEISRRGRAATACAES